MTTRLVKLTIHKNIKHFRFGNTYLALDINE